MRSFLAQLSDGLALSALCLPILPFAFPLIAWLDGGSAHYMGLALPYFAIGTVLAMLCFGVLTVVSETLGNLAWKRPSHETNAAAFRAYLLNGGRV